MIMLNDSLLVKEVVKETQVNGIIMKADDDNQYMFVKVIDSNDDFKKKIGDENVYNNVFIIRRVAKLPFLLDKYIINTKDIIGYMSEDEFNKI